MLRLKGISKAYAAPVLNDIDFSIAVGEVVALTGENGAGKSTLSKIIAGLERPDAGEMTLNKVRYQPASRVQAERSGVRMVLQELGLIGTLTVAENLELGQIPSRVGFILGTQLEGARKSAPRARRTFGCRPCATGERPRHRPTTARRDSAWACGHRARAHFG